MLSRVGTAVIAAAFLMVALPAAVASPRSTHLVSVSVRDDFGEPVFGVILAVTSTQFDGDSSSETDAQGVAEFSLPTGIYRLDVAKNGFTTERLFIAVEKPANLSVRLHEAALDGRIAGIVRDAQSGEALANVPIRIAGPALLETQAPAAALSTETGWFEFSLPVGDYVLAVAGTPFHRPRALEVSSNSSRNSSLLNIALEQADAGTSWGIIVVDTDEHPIPGARITIVSTEQQVIGSMLTNANGRATGGGLPPSAFKVKVTKAGFGAAELPLKELPEQTTVVLGASTPSSSIARVRPIDAESGRPLDAAHVQATDTETVRHSQEEWWISAGARSIEVIAPGYTPVWWNGSLSAGALLEVPLLKDDIVDHRISDSILSSNRFLVIKDDGSITAFEANGTEWIAQTSGEGNCLIAGGSPLTRSIELHGVPCSLPSVTDWFPQDQELPLSLQMEPEVDAVRVILVHRTSGRWGAFEANHSTGALLRGPPGAYLAIFAGPHVEPEAQEIVLHADSEPVLRPRAGAQGFADLSRAIQPILGLEKNATLSIAVMLPTVETPTTSVGVLLAVLLILVLARRSWKS